MIHRTGKRAKHETQPYDEQNEGKSDNMDEDDDTFVEKVRMISRYITTSHWCNVTVIVLPL